MLTSELIERLSQLQEQYGDIGVTAQSHGCCRHGHDIRTVELDNEEAVDDAGKVVREIVIRV